MPAKLQRTRSRERCTEMPRSPSSVVWYRKYSPRWRRTNGSPWSAPRSSLTTGLVKCCGISPAYPHGPLLPPPRSLGVVPEQPPTSRLSRSARLGGLVAGQSARWVGTRAANVVRSPERADAATGERAAALARELVEQLGQMRGAAMKVGQVLSTIDFTALPPEERENFKQTLGKLRDDVPPLPFKQVEKLLREELGAKPSTVFSEFEEEAFAAASIGQVHRAVTLEGRPVAVKVQYPGVAEAVDTDLRNLTLLLPLVKRLAPGLDVKAIYAELRERIAEELDYELEAQNQRSFARAYRDHPFIYVPQVITRLSRRKVLVSEFVEGIDFAEVKELGETERSRYGEIVFRFHFGSIYHLQHFNADAHPGNYILMNDGRVAFLDFGMTKKLDPEQIELEQVAVDAAVRKDPEALRVALHDLGFVKNPKKVDAERLLDHVMLVGGWYLEDREYQVSARRVMKVIESTSDPRSEYYDLMRRESIPADELMGRRMETGVLAVLAQLKAKRNWYRIMREWVYADEPATPLGEEEWEYFESRGQKRVPGFAQRPV